MRTGESGSRPGRLVEVAVDAAGAGGARPYTYAVPESLADIEDGEAVLVDFGRRQALGVVLGRADEAPMATTKPLVDRVRADGPLLPPLTLALARWIAEHYLAPPALVIRAMLPPGLLERLELVAERTPKPIGDDLDVVDADILDQLGGGARAARDLAAPDGRAGLLRRLRDLAARDLVTLDWTLLGAGAGPRYERWIRLLPAGRATADALAAGERLPGRPLGPRQVAALTELAERAEPAEPAKRAEPAEPADGVPAAEVAGRHGTATLASLVRRGFAETGVRERPRRPLAVRAPGSRGGRPRSAE